MPHTVTAPLRSAQLLCVLMAVSLGASAQKTVLSSHVPAIVKSGRAQKTAPLANSEPLSLTLNLPLRNQAALEGVLADLYNPQSPNFHKWLTPAQFDAKFAPSEEDFAAVVAWAKANNLTVTSTAANRRVVTVQATAKLVSRALHVTMTGYHDSGLNRDFRAPDVEPTLDLDVPLLSISGLDTSAPRVNHYKKGPVAASAASVAPILFPAPEAGVSWTAVKPNATIIGSGPGNTYLPTDMRPAYYGTGPLTGAGQSVAIFSYDGYLANDLTIYGTKTGMNVTSVPVTNVLTGGFDGGCELYSPCDDGEEILDILQVMGMAPGLSHIYFYEGLSAVVELNQMVMDDTAAVITSSWGGGDFGPGTTPYFLQMAAQGQTFLNATGDSGAFNSFTYLPPSSEPNIVQVGGTDMYTSSKAGPWASEVAWVDSGGGSYDPSITIPTWQQTPGVVTSANKASATLRNAPDIAAEANYDNTTVINGTFSSGYGGTSYAAPRMAGYLALANQQSVANGYGTVGFINPKLYDLGLTANATTYHDITSGTANSTIAPVVAGSTAVGYDVVTGWGSPNGPGLLNALTGPDFAIASDTPTLSLVRGTSATINITVAPSNGFTASPTYTLPNLPTGVTATFTANSPTSESITLTSAATTVVSTSSLLVTATSGLEVRTAPLYLVTAKRVAADFTLSAQDASAQQLVAAGGTSVVTVNAGGTLSGPVVLSVGTLPTGVTASFDNNNAITTANLTFVADLTAAPGVYPIVVTGTGMGSLVRTVTINLTITSPASILASGDFEGQASAWAFTQSINYYPFPCDRTCGYYPRGGTNFAVLGGVGAVNTTTLSNSFTIPASNSKATLNFWMWMTSSETTTTTKSDTLAVALYNSSGTLLTTLSSLSNLNKNSAYTLFSYDLSAYIGQTVTLKFTAVESRSKATAFLIDDVSVIVQ